MKEPYFGLPKEIVVALGEKIGLLMTKCVFDMARANPGAHPAEVDAAVVRVMKRLIEETAGM